MIKALKIIKNKNIMGDILICDEYKNLAEGPEIVLDISSANLVLPNPFGIFNSILMVFFIFFLSNLFFKNVIFYRICTRVFFKDFFYQNYSRGFY